MRAMILSAGYGTRLWPLTEDRTKPALPILGKPLVGYVAEYLAGFGYRDLVVNLHHQPQSVREALGDGSSFGVSLTYVEEPLILGTSGALDNARSLLDHETFVVINGKIITDIDLNAALQTHKRTRALATLVLMPNLLREKFSVVNVSGASVVSFSGMPRINDSEPPLMFTGIQILEPRIFEYIPHGVFSHSTTDVYPQAIAAGEQISAHVTTGKWYELSTLERYLEISLRLAAERNQAMWMGANCRISETARVENSILWDNVSIDESAVVRRAILGDGVTILKDEVVTDAAVVRADLIRNAEPPAKALTGRLRGENFVVPLAQ